MEGDEEGGKPPNPLDCFTLTTVVDVVLVGLWDGTTGEGRNVDRSILTAHLAEFSATSTGEVLDDELAVRQRVSYRVRNARPDVKRKLETVVRSSAGVLEGDSEEDGGGPSLISQEKVDEIIFEDAEGTFSGSHSIYVVDLDFEGLAVDYDYEEGGTKVRVGEGHYAWVDLTPNYTMSAFPCMMFADGNVAGFAEASLATLVHLIAQSVVAPPVLLEPVRAQAILLQTIVVCFPGPCGVETADDSEGESLVRAVEKSLEAIGQRLQEARVETSPSILFRLGAAMDSSESILLEAGLHRSLAHRQQRDSSYVLELDAGKMKTAFDAYLRSRPPPQKLESGRLERVALLVVVPTPQIQGSGAAASAVVVGRDKREQTAAPFEASHALPSDDNIVMALAPTSTSTGALSEFRKDVVAALMQSMWGADAFGMAKDLSLPIACAGKEGAICFHHRDSHPRGTMLPLLSDMKKKFRMLLRAFDSIDLTSESRSSAQSDWADLSDAVSKATKYYSLHDFARADAYLRTSRNKLEMMERFLQKEYASEMEAGKCRLPVEGGAIAIARDGSRNGEALIILLYATGCIFFLLAAVRVIVTGKRKLS